MTHRFHLALALAVSAVLAASVPAVAQTAQEQVHHMGHARGNFGDPATLHGATMPGLKELQAGSSKIKVTYSKLPTGAQITFETSDVHALTAIHRWFGAQLSEHSADAVSE